MVDLIKLVKMVAVGFLFAGCLGAILPTALEDRRRFAYLVAAPSLGVVWISGLILAPLLHYSYLHVWILGALGLSFISLQGVLFAAGNERRRTWLAAAIIFVPLIAATALMVYRPA